MKLHQLPLDDLLASLQSSPTGLTEDEATRRLREFGPNAIPSAATESGWRKLGREFVHFFAIILWLAAGLAFFAEWRNPGEGMGVLGVAILLVIAINGLFSFWQVYRAERSFSALEKLMPRFARVVRAGLCREVPNQELVPGDLLRITAGDLIPADCRLVQAFAVRVNNAIVTGESQPLIRTADPCQDEDPLQARNVLLAGTTVLAGDGQAVVFATGTHTEFGQIARGSQAASPPSFPLQREIERVSRAVAIMASILGVGFFAIGSLLGLSFWQNFLFAIGIIVANVPEGLLPTVTLALAMGAQRMAKCHVLIRHLPAVETLGSATVICTDKTGTLTENRMRVSAVYVGGQCREAAEVLRSGHVNDRFCQVLRLCHTLPRQRAGTTAESYVGDATEVALRDFAEAIQAEEDEAIRLGEIPFDSDRKRLVTVEELPGEVWVLCKGALETVAPCCATVQLGAGRLGVEPAPLSPAARAEFVRVENQLADQGDRVLAVAAKRWVGPHRHVQDLPAEVLEKDLTLLGLVSLRDPPRPEVPDAVSQCRSAGIRVIMMTGDHPRTAVGVARQIGLVESDSPVVITGERLRHLSNSQLQLAMDSSELIFARLRADQKMRIVTVLQRKGEVVAMTGDGVNDAPALKQADIGIAMGLTGADVARETADLVLADDNFAHIVQAIEEGRAVFDNVQKFMTYILTSNVPEILPYLAFVLFRIPLPLTIVQILAIDLGTDLVPALGLGAEPPDPTVMQRPPRRREQRLLTFGLLARAYGFLGLIEAAAGLTAFFAVLLVGGWRFGQDIQSDSPLFSIYLQATTACLAAIVVTQIANVYCCRSDIRSLAHRPARRSPLIIVGVALEALLLGVLAYTTPGNWLFGTRPLPAWTWGVILPFPIALVAAEELRKWIVRRSASTRNYSAAPRPGSVTTLGCPPNRR